MLKRIFPAPLGFLVVNFGVNGIFSSNDTFNHWQGRNHLERQIANLIPQWKLPNPQNDYLERFNFRQTYPTWI